MREYTTVVTRKGQITVPVAIRRALGLDVGDKVGLSISEAKAGYVLLRPVRSVAEMTFGAVRPQHKPEDLAQLRRAFEAGAAREAPTESPLSAENR